MGLSADTKVFTARFTCGIASVMLPLTSTATMISSGTFSDAKNEMVCRTLRSASRKASRGRPRTKCPPPSVTDTGM